MTNTESRLGQMNIARTCGSPAGLSETWAIEEAAKLPERCPGQQDVGRGFFRALLLFLQCLVWVSSVLPSRRKTLARKPFPCGAARR